MPARSLQQILFAQAELKRLADGQPPRSTMMKEQLEDLAKTPWQGLPTRVKKPR